MKEIVIISGKGGTGKTSIIAAFASLVENKVLCDADVDAADLHLIMDPEIKEHLGDLYYAQGDMEKAIKEWESALQLKIEMQQKIKSKISRAQSHSPLYDK